MTFVLSKLQAQPILDARKKGAATVLTSLDLQLTTVELSLIGDGVSLPDGTVLAWDNLAHIAKKDNNCFLITDDQIEAIHRFSGSLNRSYTLRATTGAPTLLISGFPMHRTKGMTPDKDTEAKMAAMGPLSGSVLDTTTGLGYASIAASLTGAQVTSIELDPSVLEIARLNPWSRSLFDNPRISQILGDSFDVIRELAANSFNAILHDPPTFSLAGDLYSLEFYQSAFRVLRAGGRIFHYIGDLDSHLGKTVSKGVVRRLQEAGFKRIVRHPAAFALVAYR